MTIRTRRLAAARAGAEDRLAALRIRQLAIAASLSAEAEAARAEAELTVEPEPESQAAPDPNPEVEAAADSIRADMERDRLAREAEADLGHDYDGPELRQAPRSTRRCTPSTRPGWLSLHRNRRPDGTRRLSWSRTRSCSARAISRSRTRLPPRPRRR